MSIGLGALICPIGQTIAHAFGLIIRAEGNTSTAFPTGQVGLSNLSEQAGEDLVDPAHRNDLDHFGFG